MTLPSTLNADINDVSFVPSDNDDDDDDDNTEMMIAIIAVASIAGLAIVLGVAFRARYKSCGRRMVTPPCGKTSDVAVPKSMEMGTISDDYGINSRSEKRSNADIVPTHEI